MENILFAGDMAGFYTSVFQNTKPEVLARYGKGEEPDKEGTVKYAHFILAGQEFAAMDSAWAHDFVFNEAVSFIVNCKDQLEIDYFWEKISAAPEAEQCGWIKDKYGVSWQIVPANMGELMGKSPEKTTPVMLKMKKITRLRSFQPVSCFPRFHSFSKTIESYSSLKTIW